MVMRQCRWRCRCVVVSSQALGDATGQGGYPTENAICWGASDTRRQRSTSICTADRARALSMGATQAAKPFCDAYTHPQPRVMANLLLPSKPADRPEQYIRANTHLPTALARTASRELRPAMVAPGRAPWHEGTLPR